MTEAISAVAPSPLSATPGVANSGTGSGSASNYDIRDFSAAMAKNGGGTNTNAVASEDNVQIKTVGQPSEGMRALLSAFDNLNGGAGKVNEIAERVAASGGDFKPSEILELTVATQEFAFQSQLTSNVANRTSDGVQQLFRQQS